VLPNNLKRCLSPRACRRTAVDAMSGRHFDNARSRATDDLLGRIMSILDAARGQVVRAVNHATVSAYWHIGRAVVEALQQGGERATCGKALIERLAQQLTHRYGKGFCATNLGYFRQFYLAYRDRIPHSPGGESQPKPDPRAIPRCWIIGGPAADRGRARTPRLSPSRCLVR
jgi:hypothetical protein